MTKIKEGYVEGVVSVVVNSGLFVLKLWTGIVTGSIALTADAWHTFSDSISSIVVIIAVRLSSQKPDKEHPFGHGRWEQIAALFIAFFLSLIAFNIFKDSLFKFTHHEQTQFGLPAIAVTVISIVIKEALAQYAFYLGRITNNVTIKADGWHHRSDALSSIAVLFGIIFAKQFWWTDSVLGIIIALMLFYATCEIAREAIVKLLGEIPNDELINKITEAVRSVYHGDLQLHHFHIHNYVAHQELTFHIRLDNNMTIEKGHRIATDIETIIRENFNITATVHVEPLEHEYTATDTLLPHNE